ncbi:MAG: hypothetical protein JSW17_05815 [Candidatus Omnitrophota bacterium]|nr:MAG: hypothetical protein JSW17_05815 [Candidatus Omnitrophota bacterium]
MKVEVKKVDKLKRAIKVDIEGEAFLKEKKEAFCEIGKNLKTPGFRPGKVPLEQLQKHHGKALKEEFLKQALPLYYQRALEEHKLLAVGFPRIYDVELSDERLSFCAEFEIKPELDIKETDYKGLKLKDKDATVEEIEIEKVITNIKEGIKKVSQKDLADQDLSKWAGYPSVARLREAIGAELMVEKLRTRKQEIENQVVRQFLKNIKFDLPQSVVERHHKELVEREIYNLRMQGVAQDDIDKYKKEVENKTQSLAEDEVKLFFILEAIAKKEDIKIERNLRDVVLGFILSCAEYQ